MYTLASRHMTPVEDYIIKGRLEAEGLFAVVLFEHHIWAQWPISHALGGIRHHVPYAMADIAYKIIQKNHSG
jgi:hypothetical protein